MARAIWRNFLALLYAPDRPDGFRPVAYGIREDGRQLMEIPWITTNFTAQWCLKAIVAADLIADSLPRTFQALDEALRGHPSEYRLYGA